MFNNVGKKLMGLAEFVCWVGIILSAIFGIVIMAESRGIGWVGFLIILFGSLLSWISSWALYALGEITDNIAELKKNKIGHISERLDELANIESYRNAHELLKEGQYDQAAETFKKLGLFRDSAEQAKNCLEAKKSYGYPAAKALFDAGKFSEAAAAFKKLGDYQDSANLAKECDYLQSKILYAARDYKGAGALLYSLQGYKDVDSLLSMDENLAAAVAEKAERDAAWSVGNCIKFGRYEQGTKVPGSKKAVKWLILERIGTKALILSCYGLDSKPYDTKNKAVTWENCTLRAWLNKDFLNAAFSPSEQAAIQTTAVDNSKSQCYPDYTTDGGNNTEDKVFLLSYAEAWKYFISDEARKCLPTAYAIAQGAWTNSSDKLDGKATGVWWLRSPGGDQDDASYVSTDGSRNNYLVGSTRHAVRPALWVDIESGT